MLDLLALQIHELGLQQRVIIQESHHVLHELGSERGVGLYYFYPRNNLNGVATKFKQHVVVSVDVAQQEQQGFLRQEVHEFVLQLRLLKHQVYYLTADGLSCISFKSKLKLA